jgi:hypothetical protein
MLEDGPSRRRMLAGLGSGLTAVLSGCGLFRPPETAQSTSTAASPTATPTATATASPTATATAETTATTPLDPGSAVSVTDVVFGVREREDDGVEEDDNNTGWAVVDADVTIRNDSERPLRRVGLVVDAVYESATVTPRVVVTDTIGGHWPDGLAPGDRAVLSPEHLYFEQDGPPWYDLQDDHYSLAVTVRVAEPL